MRSKLIHIITLSLLFLCLLATYGSCLKDLVLAGIFPIHGRGGWAGGQGCYPAAKLALEDVNNQTDLLPGYNLKLMWNDSECEPGKGITILYDLLYNDPQKIMLLGPGCSTVTTTIAEAAKMWNLIVMSYGASSPALSDRTRFKTFFRTHPSANLNNPAYVKLFLHYGWTKINIIQEAEEVFVSNVENLEMLCKKQNIEVVTRQSFLHSAAEAVRNLKLSDARIIVGLFYETSARKVFCEAYKNGLYGSRIVWLIIGWYPDNWFKVEDKEVNCTAEQLQEALEGHLTTESLIKNLNNVTTVSAMSTDGFFDKLNKMGLGPEHTGGYVEAPLAYDAVWAIALAFNRTIRELAKTGRLLEDFTYSDEYTSKVLYDEMQRTEFEGVSGRVSFTKEGDRLAQTQIEQLQDGQYRILGYYDPFKKEIQWSTQYKDRWRGPGGRHPRHETLVYPVKRMIERYLFWMMVSMAALGIILAISCLVFNFTHRMRRLIQLSHPNINNLMLAGIILCLIAVILLGLDAYYDTVITVDTFPILCQARAWVLTIGFTLSYGSMFSKIWNVHRLSTHAKKESKREARRSAGRGSFKTTSFAEIRTFSSLVQTQKVESWHLYIVVVGLLIVDVILLALWAGIHPLHWHPLKFLPEKAGNPDDDIEHEPILDQCVSEKDTIWIGVIFAYKGLFLIFGLFLAYETRSVKIKELNDSRFVGMSIYNVVVLCLITAPVTLIINKQHNAKFAFVALSIMFCSYLSMGVIFVPKVLEIYRRKGDRADSKKMEDSLPSREEEERHQKLLAENEELKKQIKEKEEKVRLLQEKIKERAAERARLTREHEKIVKLPSSVKEPGEKEITLASKESNEKSSSSGEKQVISVDISRDRHSDSALPSSTGA